MLVEWFAAYGQVAVYLVQMLYWVVIAAAVAFAAYQFKRLVDIKVEKAERKADEELRKFSKKADKEASKAAEKYAHSLDKRNHDEDADDDIDVEKFVD